MPLFFKGKDGKVVEVPDDAIIERVVLGESQSVSARQLFDDSCMKPAAEQRFREAADLKKKAEPLLRMQELAPKAETDDEAFLELAKLNGLGDQEARQRLQEYRQLQQGQTPAAGGGKKTEEEEDEEWEEIFRELEAEEKKEAGKAGSKAVDPTIAKKIEELEGKTNLVLSNYQMDARDKALGQMRVLIDKAPGLGKLGSKAKDHLVEKMEAVVVSGLQQGRQYGPGLLQEALTTVGKFAEEIGLAPAEAEQTKVLEEKLQGLGLGPAETGGMASVKAGTPPERKPVTSEDYQENLAQRYLAGAFQEKAESGE